MGTVVEKQMEDDLEMFSLSICKNQGVIILKEHPRGDKVGNVKGPTRPSQARAVDGTPT